MRPLGSLQFGCFDYVDLHAAFAGLGLDRPELAGDPEVSQGARCVVLRVTRVHDEHLTVEGDVVEARRHRHRRREEARRSSQASTLNGLLSRHAAQRFRCASAILARPSGVFGPVDAPT
jgi:hypothetical protein